MATSSKFMELLSFLPSGWDEIANEADNLEQKISDISANLDNYRNSTFSTLNNITAGINFDSAAIKDFIRGLNFYDKIKDVRLDVPALISIPEDFDSSAGKTADLVKEKVILLKPLLEALLGDDPANPVKSNRLVELINGVTGAEGNTIEDGIIDISVQFYADSNSADTRTGSYLRKQAITRLKPKITEALDIFSGKWDPASTYAEATTGSPETTTVSPLETLNNIVGAITGSLLFSAGDYIAYTSLADKLRDGSDSVSAFLQSGFEPATNDLLSVHVSGTEPARELKNAMIAELNTVLESGSSVYEATRFSGITLSEETQQLENKEDRSDVETLRLNRLLLENAFPEMTKDPETIDEYIDWAKVKKEALYEELGTADPAASGEGSPDLLAQLGNIVSSLQDPATEFSLGNLTAQVKGILPPLPKEVEGLFDALSNAGSNAEASLNDLLGPVFDSLPNVNLDLRDLSNKAQLLFEFLRENNVRISIKSVTAASTTTATASTTSTTTTGETTTVNSTGTTTTTTSTGSTTSSGSTTSTSSTTSTTTLAVDSTGTSSSLFEEIFGDSLDEAIAALPDEDLRNLATNIRDDGLSAAFGDRSTAAFADSLKTEFPEEQKSNFPEVFGEGATPSFSQILNAFIEVQKTAVLAIFPDRFAEDLPPPLPTLSESLDVIADTIVSSINALIAALKAALNELINTVFDLVKLAIELIQTIQLPVWITNLISFVTGRDNLNPFYLLMALPYSVLKRFLNAA